MASTSTLQPPFAHAGRARTPSPGPGPSQGPMYTLQPPPIHGGRRTRTPSPGPSALPAWIATLQPPTPVHAEHPSRTPSPGPNALLAPEPAFAPAPGPVHGAHVPTFAVPASTAIPPAATRTRARGTSPSGGSGIPTSTFRFRTRFSEKDRKYKVAKPKGARGREGAPAGGPSLTGGEKQKSRPGTGDSANKSRGFAGAPRDEDAYILVMGPSGSGKTSFINLASDSQLPVSSGLKACTTDVALSEPFVVDGQRVRLVDTPGFDDTAKSDGDVLAIIAEFLAKHSSRGRRIHSILYFHRISDVRMGAVSKKNFVMFQKMVGAHAYPNVVVVTTRWNEVNTLTAESREAELRTKTSFFQPLVEAGAPMMRYARTPDCTQRIVRQALSCAPVELSIQRQMVVERRSVAETDAGMKLQLDKMESIEKCKDELRDLVRDLEALRDVNDLDGLKELEGSIRDMRDKVRDLQEENQRLMSRQNSETWEMIGYVDESLLAEPAPVSDDSSDDEDPPMIGGLPLDEFVYGPGGGVLWGSWVLGLHYAVLSSFFGLVHGHQ